MVKELVGSDYQTYSKHSLPRLRQETFVNAYKERGLDDGFGDNALKGEREKPLKGGFEAFSFPQHEQTDAGSDGTLGSILSRAIAS